MSPVWVGKDAKPEQAGHSPVDTRQAVEPEHNGRVPLRRHGRPRPGRAPKLERHGR